MYYVLCTMHYVLCTMYYVLCTMYYVLHEMLGSKGSQHPPVDRLNNATYNTVSDKLTSIMAHDHLECVYLSEMLRSKGPQHLPTVDSLNNATYIIIIRKIRCPLIHICCCSSSPKCRPLRLRGVRIRYV
jgi:hypothetical protein